jgi:dihydropteroate synthase
LTEPLYLRSLGLLAGAAAAASIASGDALPLGGGPAAFSQIGLMRRLSGGGAELTPVPVSRLGAVSAPASATLDRLTRPLQPWAGFALDRPLVMGIVNVTPDSFSDGGDFGETAAAIAHGRALRAAGADILDIGGESTRPGADPVSQDEEIARIVPVIRALAGDGAIVSVDTRHAQVMAAALDAGARIVNDVTALAGSGALELVARRQVPVVLMHMQGDPRTMQQAPHYESAPLDVFDYLAARLDAVEAAGLARSFCLVDPGIGFGKNLDHNIEILDALGLYRGLGCGLMLGASRKRLIAGIMGGEVAPKHRLAGSIALGLAGLDAGANILRVHDVAETVQAVRVWQAVRGQVTDR